MQAVILVILAAIVVSIIVAVLANKPKPPRDDGDVSGFSSG
jgi:preprotein translocase subunit SecG